MTSQLQGEVLFSGWSGTDETTHVYTPWMPVNGDFATFGVELTGGPGGLTVTWGVETRSYADPTVSVVFSGETISTVGTVGTKTSTSTSAKELVRYRFSTTSTASASAYVLMRALQPSWSIDR